MSAPPLVDRLVLVAADPTLAGHPVVVGLVAVVGELETEMVSLQAQFAELRGENAELRRQSWSAALAMVRRCRARTAGIGRGAAASQAIRGRPGSRSAGAVSGSDRAPAPSRKTGNRVPTCPTLAELNPNDPPDNQEVGARPVGV